MSRGYYFNLTEQAIIDKFEHELAKYRGISKSEQIRNYIMFSLDLIEKFRSEGHVTLAPPTEEKPAVKSNYETFKTTGRCELRGFKIGQLDQAEKVCRRCREKNPRTYKECGGAEE